MRLEKEMVVRRPDGLHARPAGDLVKRLKKYSSTVQFIYKDKTIDAKSIIQLMKLSCKQGSVVQVIIDGQDAEEAITSVQEYLDHIIQK